MLSLGLRADGDHAASRCRQLPRLLASMRPHAQEGSRRRAGCRMLRLWCYPCPLRAAQAALVGQLLPPQHLLRLPPALLLQHPPQVLADWLCAALLLCLLQNALGNVRPRLLPCSRMRLPALGLPDLGLLGLGLSGRPSGHIGSMVHHLRRLPVTVKAGHGAESIQGCMRSRLAHLDTRSLWTLHSITPRILIQERYCFATGVLNTWQHYHE